MSQDHTRLPPTRGEGQGQTLNAEFAQAILRPLAFRMAERADAGENIAIGQPLRQSLEHALSEAAYRIELTDGALRDLFLAMKAEDTPLHLRTAAAVLRAKAILFRTQPHPPGGNSHEG